MEDLLLEIRNAWGWVGINPAEIIGQNDFGNLIIKTKDGKYWRLKTPPNRADLEGIYRCFFYCLFLSRYHSPEICMKS